MSTAQVRLSASEEDPRYLALVDPVFDRLDAGTLVAVTSPVTLAECLVMPYRNNQVELQQVFSDLIVNGAQRPIRFH